MKFVDKAPTKKVKQIVEVVEKPIGRIEVPTSIEDWLLEHRKHGYQVTSSWAGMCWADSRDYYNIYCGCGSRIIQKTSKHKCTVEECEPKPNPMNYPLGSKHLQNSK